MSYLFLSPNDVVEYEQHSGEIALEIHFQKQ